MGKVSGDLDVLGIANLLQTLTLNPSLGRLTVVKDADRKVVHFGPQGIRLLSGGPRVSLLGEILLRTQRVTREQLDQILAGKRNSGLTLGEYVIREKILTQEDIDGALREQVTDEICDLFTWTHGTFEFTQEAGAAEDGLLSTVLLGQDVMSIALEAARRMDQMARIRAIIPDERLTPVLLEIPAILPDPGVPRDALEEILPLMDGRRSVVGIIEQSLYPRFTVLLTLYALAQLGAIKLRDAGAPGGPETVHLGWESGSDTLRPHARILLMGDPSTSRLSLSMCLKNMGFEVMETPVPPDPRGLLSRVSFDAVILDLAIDTDSGLAACTRFAEVSSLPFIVTTARGGREATVNARKSGARHVLLKPISPELLLDRLNDLFRPVPAA